MELDMTKGSPSKLITKFIIPIIIGNIFQQLYSMVDGDHAAAEDRCGQPAGAVDSGLYADGRRRQLMQQHRAKQRFPAYACRRDA